MKAALDSSVVIASLLSWHEQHAESVAAVERLLSGEHEVVLPSRVLVESFSVMTRLPAPHRLRPTDALAALDGTFRRGALVVDIERRHYWKFLSGLSERQIRGGRAYDAEIVEAALRTGVDAIVTLNPDDFMRLVPDPTIVVGPGDLLDRR